MPKKTLAPPSRAELMRVVATRLPASIISLIDRIGDHQMRSRADIIRALAVEALQHRGLVERGAAVLDEVPA